MGKEKLMGLPFFLLFLLLAGCRPDFQKSDTLFQALSSDETGVHFNNKLTTDDSVNVLSYEYLYNGGGVGIADFNNDSLPDIFFSGNMVPCRLYVNKKDFVFEDLTEKSGIDTKDIWAYGVSIVDINQDGWQDIYLCTGGMKNRDQDVTSNKLYVNQGNLTFVESAAAYGLAVKGESIQSTFLDYDRDGDLDMFLLKGGGFEKSAITPFPILKDGTSRNTDRLFRNDFDAAGHPKFTDVSREAGILLEGFGLGVSVLDINVDGWPDLYVTNDYLSKDHLYVNNQNGTFTDRVDEYFKHVSHFAMGNDVGDINNDGRQDILAVDMLPEDNYHRKIMFGPNQYDKFYFAVSQGYGYQYMRNTLQLANENGSYSEIGQLAGIEKTEWSWAPLIADFDNDGFQDIVISNGYGKDVTNLDYLKFMQPMLGLSKEERKKKLLDRPAVVVPNFAFKNNRDNTFSKSSAEWGFNTPSMSSGMAYVDFDLDGDLDLVVNNIDQEAFVFRNTTREKNPNTTNYIKIRLAGTEKNKDGLGATVVVRSGELLLSKYVTPVHGFESSVENIVHFGLGGNSKIDSITVIWGDGKIGTVTNNGINQMVTMHYTDSRLAAQKKDSGFPKTLLTRSNEIKFRHSENEFNDFLYQPLLQHKLSQNGPGIAVGDVNNDGFEDMFVGGSYRLPAHLMIQNARGNFTIKEFADDYESEDQGALFFDSDSDGDQDLYVVSGGVEFFEGHQFYQDRLYRNDGRGNFKKDGAALPKMSQSGSCVVGGDYDSDGDLDLFVGGRSVPEKYPTPANSYILRNDDGNFTDVTTDVAPQLQALGMVTAGLWTDFDNDERLDLLVAGEAMPIKVFKNSQDGFHDITATSGLKDSDGFWNSLVSGDFDNDGDMDYVAGNLGVNGPMKASAKEPVVINYADFDNNGSIEPLIGYYEGENNYPIPALDILASQLPALKKKILQHKDYATYSMNDLVGITGTSNYKTIYCKMLESAFVRNNGGGKFEITPLPQQAQVAPVFGLLAEDINGDGNLDLLGVGNSYSQEIVYGRFDALKGVTFLGDGKGNFNFVGSVASGFMVDGDAKGIARIETSKGSRIIVTQNNDSLKAFTMPASVGRSNIDPGPDDTHVTYFLKGSRQRKFELNYGSTYLSQSSRKILVNDAVDSIKIFNSRGKLSRAIRPKSVSMKQQH